MALNDLHSIKLTTSPKLNKTRKHQSTIVA